MAAHWPSIARPLPADRCCHLKRTDMNAVAGEHGVATGAGHPVTLAGPRCARVSPALRDVSGAGARRHERDRSSVRRGQRAFDHDVGPRGGRLPAHEVELEADRPIQTSGQRHSQQTHPEGTHRNSVGQAWDAVADARNALFAGCTGPHDRPPRAPCRCPGCSVRRSVSRPHRDPSRLPARRRRCHRDRRGNVRRSAEMTGRAETAADPSIRPPGSSAYAPVLDTMRRTPTTSTRGVHEPLSLRLAGCTRSTGRALDRPLAPGRTGGRLRLPASARHRRRRHPGGLLARPGLQQPHPVLSQHRLRRLPRQHHLPGHPAGLRPGQPRLPNLRPGQRVRFGRLRPRCRPLRRPGSDPLRLAERRQHRSVHEDVPLLTTARFRSRGHGDSVHRASAGPVLWWCHL